MPFIGDDSVEWSDASLASCLNNIYKLSPAFIKVNDKTNCNESKATPLRLKLILG